MAIKPLNTTLSARAKDFIMSQKLEPCSFDGVHFWINPSTIRVRTERIQTLMPTMNGVIRFSYGTRPIIITMDGMTGLGGIDYLLQWDSIRPMHGNPDVPHKFVFPARFPGDGIDVYIDWIEDSMIPDTPLYHYYTMQLIALDLSPNDDFILMNHDPTPVIDPFTPSDTPLNPPFIGNSRGRP